MSFAALIVLHNSARELTALLESIDAHLAVRPQVICADSGSSDDGADVARNWGAEVLVMDGNPGYGAANNAALELVREEVTVLLNPDSLLIDGGIVGLAEIARASRALVAPRLLNNDRTVQDSAHPLPGGRDGYLAALTVPRLLPTKLRNRLQPFRSTTRTEVGWAIGACLAAKTSLLRQLGPFDPADFLFAEDLDLCLRARALGIPTIFDPSVSLVHSGAHTSRGELNQERFDLQARRRREVVLQQLGEGALRRDDRTQALTFTARAALGRDPSRNKMLLAALRSAQNRSS
jgi:N-acetylglucosaminyl-diphospho-decaprenol L-rhamnosyltransferase